MKIGRLVTSQMIKISGYGISNTGMFSVPNETRICEVCGKKFKPQSRIQKYCSVACRRLCFLGTHKQIYLKRKFRSKLGSRIGYGIANKRKEI